MELQTNDSKKIFKVFDASKRKRARKKREGHEDTNSVGTDDSNSARQAAVDCIMSGKASLQDLPTANPNGDSTARDRDRSLSISHEEQRSPRRHRRQRDGMSLALKAGMVSPRSVSPAQETDARAEAPAYDHDSIIYTFLEDAIKRDKKKRHGRRHEDREHERDREHEQETREHRHRHRHHRRDEVPSRDRDKNQKEESTPAVNQTVLLETFAKLCAKMNENAHNSSVQRTQSHKSLQCEVASRRDLHSNRCPARVANHEPLKPHESPTYPRTPTNERYHESDTLTGIRSQENCHQIRNPENVGSRHVNCSCYFDKDPKHDKYYEKNSKYAPKIDHGKEPRYSSKVDVERSRVVVNPRTHDEERCPGYSPRAVDTRTCVYPSRERPRDCRDYDRRNYEEERRRCVEQKTSRSFEVHRDGYEEERCRRTSRSDTKDKRYDDKFYEKPIEATERHFPSKERRVRRPSDRFDRNSIASREEYRERDRYSERERDSGLSVADGETDTMSGRTGRSNCLRVVKQEIAEQREAMDKMMKLWKELMRCFKGISQTQDKDKTVNESTCESVRDSAAAQLQLWRECMRRYETVARDVGDTDARLMEEINKQRSEMSEMASMWHECLQRYRDMSNDFNTLKQQLATAESPTRLPAVAPLVCAEGEGTAPGTNYRVPHTYPQLAPGPGGGGCGGAALRGRASAPPAWWWRGEHPPARHRRSSRHSSPDSRDGRATDRAADRDRRHRHKEPRDESRYKEKSKPGAARSDHRRRKR